MIHRVPYSRALCNSYAPQIHRVELVAVWRWAGVLAGVTRSANAEPYVSFLYRLFRSGQKHLQPELDCMCLNRFHRGPEAFVIHLERCSEISRVLPKPPIPAAGDGQ